MKPTLQVPFNELSLVPPAPDISSATALMKGFDATLRGLRNWSNPVLRTARTLASLEVATSVSVAQWLSQSGIDRELQRSLRSELTKGPFCEELVADHEREADSIDACCGGQRGVGLTHAWFEDRAVISLSTGPWAVDPLAVEIQRISALSEDIETTSHEYVNFHSNQTLAERTSWFDEFAKSLADARLASGPLMLANLAEVLPRLTLTSVAREQIQSLSGGEPVYPTIKRHLQALNAHAHKWEVGRSYAVELPLNCSPEGETTLKQFGEQRTAILPDGSSHIFSWHTKLADGWRIYFEPLPATRSVVIGLVTPHLQTKKHR